MNGVYAGCGDSSTENSVAAIWQDEWIVETRPDRPGADRSKPATRPSGAYPRFVPSDVMQLRGGPTAAAIRRERLIVVLRRIAPRSRLIDLVNELVDAGARVFEITLDDEDAPADLVAVREQVAGRAALVGAGTVRTGEQLEGAIAAQAHFGVSPVIDRAIVAASLDAGLPFVPGASTPTEADAAWRAGATFVKLFPGSSLGPTFVRELRGPLPEIETIVTGGVDSSNAVAFLEAGAVAVGIGSAIVRAGAAERQALIASIAPAAAPSR
jgi:2-dehydro-3-deoxyphosphogluconate aldolase/(4S)-4-hydroxy-2-oxoglutarate aldolase